MKKEKAKKIVRERGGKVAKGSSSCCAYAPAPTKSGNSKTLKIEWQRLISSDKTCPRCWLIGF